MTDERCKQIMEQLGMPNSRSLMQALFQVANETEQEVRKKLTSDNNDYAKLPTIEECYQAIPFPSNECECAMFVAGIAECHKFVSWQFT